MFVFCSWFARVFISLLVPSFGVTFRLCRISHTINFWFLELNISFAEWTDRNIKKNSLCCVKKLQENEKFKFLHTLTTFQFQAVVFTFQRMKLLELGSRNAFQKFGFRTKSLPLMLHNYSVYTMFFSSFRFFFLPQRKWIITSRTE